MQTAGARILREDDNDMSREAVLLQWERKIEAAEREPDTPEVPTAAADATTPGPRRFERRSEAPAAPAPRPVPDARIVTITGESLSATRPLSATRARRRSVLENQMAQPDRIALWAFLLGLFLVAVAAGTAHA